MLELACKILWVWLCKSLFYLFSVHINQHRPFSLLMATSSSKLLAWLFCDNKWMIHFCGLACYWSLYIVVCESWENSVKGKIWLVFPCCYVILNDCKMLYTMTPESMLHFLHERSALYLQPYNVCFLFSSSLPTLKRWKETWLLFLFESA